MACIYHLYIIPTLPGPRVLAGETFGLMVVVRRTTPPPPVCLSVSSLCVSPPSILRRKRVGIVRTPLGDRDVLGGSSEFVASKWIKTKRKVGASEVIL